MIEPVIYNSTDKVLELIDQTLLPVECKTAVCKDYHQVAEAIVTMKVRGAPAIGVAAAYGLCLALHNESGSFVADSFLAACKLLSETRPTAVNLFAAIDRVKKSVLDSNPVDFASAYQTALKEADSIKAEDLAMCKKMGELGASLLKNGQTWLTHCNAGALATAGYGTALGVFRAAKEQGKKFKVFVDETRPLLQGSRLTAWELMHDRIDATLICDNMAGSLIAAGKVDAIVVGADRITSKGFVANKIGTYPLALMAKYHGIPFYVVAPDTTFDLSLSYAEEIVIEERDPDEVRFVGSQQVAPADIPVYNPAFDITPPELITAIITNLGIIEPIYRDTIPQVFANGGKL